MKHWSRFSYPKPTPKVLNIVHMPKVNFARERNFHTAHDVLDVWTVTGHRVAKIPHL